MADQWLVQRDNKTIGPMPAAKLKQLVQAGKLQPSDLVQKQGMDRFVPARAVMGLFPEASTPKPTAVAPAAPEPAPSVKTGAASPTKTPWILIGVGLGLIFVGSVVLVVLVSGALVIAQFVKPSLPHLTDGPPATTAESPKPPVDISFDPLDLASVMRAAQQGNAEAQNTLGHRYYHGEGVAKDQRQAVKWYQQAASQGLPAAQYFLGWCYEHGEGVAQNKPQALAWYRKAAEQNFADAFKALAELDPAGVPAGNHDLENPFLTSQVGDWVVYRQFGQETAGKFEFEVKLTMVSKTADEAVIVPMGRFVGRTGGLPLTGKRISVDLTVPFDQVRPTAFLTEIDPDIESSTQIVGRGKEKITVAGKEYDCSWIKVETTVGSGLLQMVTHEQVWLSKSVPLTGMVRSEAKNRIGTAIMELKEMGHN